MIIQQAKQAGLERIAIIKVNAQIFSSHNPCRGECKCSNTTIFKDDTEKANTTISLRYQRKWSIRQNSALTKPNLNLQSKNINSYSVVSESRNSKNSPTSCYSTVSRTVSLSNVSSCSAVVVGDKHMSKYLTVKEQQVNCEKQ